MPIWIILLIVFFVAFGAAPKWLKFCLLLINLFLPDSIPFLDEVVMIAMFLRSDRQSRLQTVLPKNLSKKQSADYSLR